MRLIKFLNEENIDLDCSEFIKEWKKVGFESGALYRGMTVNSISDFQKFTPPPYRFPKDSTLTSTNWVDDVYKKNLGISLRTKSIFVTHDKNSARAYGTVYYFLPKNGYKLYTNPMIRDAYIDVFPPLDKEPLLAQSGKILDPFDCIDYSRYEVDAKYGTILKSHIKKCLVPSVAVMSDKARLAILNVFCNDPYVNGIYIFENKFIKQLISEGFFGNLFTGIFGNSGKSFDKPTKSMSSNDLTARAELSQPTLPKDRNKPGIQIPLEQAYEQFWVPAYRVLLRHMTKLFEQTKRVDLKTACSRPNEIMVHASDYYLATENFVKSKIF